MGRWAVILSIVFSCFGVVVSIATGKNSGAVFYGAMLAILALGTFAHTKVHYKSSVVFSSMYVLLAYDVLLLGGCLALAMVALSGPPGGKTGPFVAGIILLLPFAAFSLYLTVVLYRRSRRVVANHPD